MRCCTAQLHFTAALMVPLHCIAAAAVMHGIAHTALL
jgi:hypothetical protein